MTSSFIVSRWTFAAMAAVASITMTAASGAAWSSPPAARLITLDEFRRLAFEKNPTAARAGAIVRSTLEDQTTVQSHPDRIVGDEVSDVAAAGHDAHGQHSDRHHGGGAAGHVHAAVPREYAHAHVPAAAWTSPAMIARGREIYAARCAACHGEHGDGQGPAAAALPLKPPDLRDARMVGEMPGNYWFWRVSEGGAAEPFRARGSTMPAWKDVLSVEDRRAVIAYMHTFSGHHGPHETSEHPELVGHGGS